MAMKKTVLSEALPRANKGQFFLFLVRMMRRNGVGCKDRRRMMNALRAGLEASVWAAIGRAKTAATIAKRLASAAIAGGHKGRENHLQFIFQLCVVPGLPS
ncbi:MAG: hypothetical protein WC518_04000 [Patescibacteria group bacterium]